MIISIIAAVGTNGVIGRERDLPWTMPADMRFFTQTTLRHHVIMGRKSFEDILSANSKPLLGRTNIVITRTADAELRKAWEATSVPTAPVLVVNSLADAIATAKRGGETEVFIIGGAEIFALGLEIAERLYITRIHAAFEGDTFFPSMAIVADTAETAAINVWRETDRRDYPADVENPHSYSFTTLERV